MFSSRCDSCAKQTCAQFLKKSPILLHNTTKTTRASFLPTARPTTDKRIIISTGRVVIRLFSSPYSLTYKAGVSLIYARPHYKSNFAQLVQRTTHFSADRNVFTNVSQAPKCKLEMSSKAGVQFGKLWLKKSEPYQTLGATSHTVTIDNHQLNIIVAID